MGNGSDPAFRATQPVINIGGQDDLSLGEGLVSHMVQSALKNRQRELETLKRDTAKLANVRPPFPRISYEEAIRILNKHGNSAKMGDDFGGDEETLL